MSRFIAQLAVAIALSFGLVLAVAAQDQATPTSGGDQTLCATPLPEASGSPAIVTTAPPTAATPGGSEPGTPIGLFPCGSPAASPAAQGGQAAQQTVEMVDINFNPKELTIPANTDVAINLTNNGVSPHNFNVDELNVHSGDYAAGQTGTVTINAAPGSYQYYCSIPGHKEAGMVGTLTVQ